MSESKRGTVWPVCTCYAATPSHIPNRASRSRFSPCTTRQMIMFPPTGLPAPNELLLVTDQLASPADFLLHRFLSAHLKQSKEARCLILSLSESLTRWKVLAGKAVSNVATSYQYVSSYPSIPECQLNSAHLRWYCRVHGQPNPSSPARITPQHER